MRRLLSGFILPLVRVALGACITLSSCRRDPILDEQGEYRLNFIVSDSTLYLHPADPQLMQVHLYDPATDRCVRSMYAYPSGLDFYVTPGDYHIVAYAVERNATTFTYTDRFDLLTASSDLLGRDSSYGDIIAAPSQVLYGDLRRFRIPYVSTMDGPLGIDVRMDSPLDSWMVRITGIDNLEYCRSVRCYITGQYRELDFKGMERKGRAVVTFGGGVSADLTLITAPFATFGMIPGSPYTLQVQLTDSGGFDYQATVDVTAQVLDPANRKHIITVNLDWVLQTLVPGGLEPTADEWDVREEHTEIQ